MASTMLIYGVYVSQVHYMCVGLCGLVGQLLFHVLSSLALLDMESDGVNDGSIAIPWFYLVGSKFTPKFNE
jgi:hypothetical protein